MTSFPPNDYFFSLMTRDPCPWSHSGPLSLLNVPYLLNVSPWRLTCFGDWAVVDDCMRCAPKKKMRKKWSINLFFVPPQCLWMPASVLWPKRLPTSLKNISNGSVSNIFDDHIALSRVILDMEAAQVQGLGAAIIRLKMNNSSVRMTTEVDPDVIVQYLIKLCFVHWERYGFSSIPCS